MAKPRGRDESKPRRYPHSGEKPTLRSKTIKDQPTYRHYGRTPLKRRNGVPVLASQIPINVLPREMIEPLNDNMVRFLVSFWKMGHENEALAAIGFTRGAFDQWKRRHPAFVEAYTLMKGIVDDYWEAELERSWTEGYEEHRDVYDKAMKADGEPLLDEKGEQVYKRRRAETRVKRDPSIVKEIVRARLPEKYAQPGKGGGGVQINITVERPDTKEEIPVVEHELLPAEVVEEDGDLER